jgi:hypothetical protein
MWVDKSKPPYIQNIGQADGSKSLREWIDSLRLVRDINQASRKVRSAYQKTFLQYSARRVAALDQISTAKARLYK